MVKSYPMDHGYNCQQREAAWGEKWTNFGTFPKGGGVKAQSKVKNVYLKSAPRWSKEKGGLGSFGKVSPLFLCSFPKVRVKVMTMFLIGPRYMGTKVWSLEISEY